MSWIVEGIGRIWREEVADEASSSEDSVSIESLLPSDEELEESPEM